MKIHQNFIALFIAAGFSVLVLLVNIFLLAPHGLLRMGFAAAFYLLSRDSVAGATLAKGPRTAKNPDRWIYAFTLGFYFGTFMLLATWRGIETLPKQLVGVTIGAALFGLLIAFAFESKPNPYSHHFQTEKPIMFGAVGRRLYYAAPVLKLALIWLAVHFSPPTLAYLFFYIILIGFAFPRFARKTNGNFLWANFPTMVGYLILVLLIGFHL